MGEQEVVDVSRRDLGSVLAALGGAAGSAALAGCAERTATGNGRAVARTANLGRPYVESGRLREPLTCFLLTGGRRLPVGRAWHFQPPNWRAQANPH